MTSDLVVDSQIRGWVFLPIVVITFLVGILRHYISILLTSQKKVEAQQLQDRWVIIILTSICQLLKVWQSTVVLFSIHFLSIFYSLWRYSYLLYSSQLILRSRLLRENCKYIPRNSFLVRRYAFNREEDGYLTQKRPPVSQNMMTDPTMMTDMLKGNLTNVLPMIIIGGWINWMFSGFITSMYLVFWMIKTEQRVCFLTAKVPFPLTLRFQSMLQRGIELTHLDASWVSSASWYFLNVFGLRSIYALVLGENNGKYGCFFSVCLSYNTVNM